MIQVSEDAEQEVLPARAATTLDRPGAMWAGQVLRSNRDQELPGAEDQEAPCPAARPLWLVATLTVLTFGLYIPIWFGMTWSEIKRERRDDTMHPWWHALTLLVPFYGWFRFHAHYRTIGDLLESVGTYLRVRPGRALVGYIVGDVLVEVGSRTNRGWSISPEVELATNVVGAVLLAMVLVHGQQALNRYWTTAYPRRAAMHVRRGEWILLACSVVWCALVVLGTLL